MDYLPRKKLLALYAALDRRTMAQRLEAAMALASVRGMRYLDDAGRARLIDLSLLPWVITTAQLQRFYGAVHAIAQGLYNLWPLYQSQPAVREVIRLSAEEESWLRLMPRRSGFPMSVIGRLDCTAIYDQANWWDDFVMLEPNAVGVGGVHYAPVGCSVLLDAFGDLLAKAVPGKWLRPAPDPRQLLLAELKLVAKKAGRPLRSVAFLENTDFTTGTDEFGHLAAYFSRLGLKSVVADPRHLRISRGEIYAGKERIDFFYRDSELGEFMGMESGGKKLTALRLAVKEGRLISSLAWELDQKSAWEIFTADRFARHFSTDQRRFFKKHILWTRLVREARVEGPQGRTIDLIPFIRRNREGYVLKPNTLFGGEGVTIGCEVTQRHWERTLAKALKGPQDYVFQKLARIHSQTLPVKMRGQVQFVERSTVSGFYFNSTGIGLVGRFSPRTVVNVSQGGGLIPALWLD